MCFLASVIVNITNQSQYQHFSVIFLMMCTFSYGHLFLVSIFYQLTSEKNQVHTSNLTHFRQTLPLFTVSLISLSSVHLFVYFPNITLIIAARKCMEHIKCVQLLTF